MRGYFAIGVDRISKPMNMGSLMRSAHAFGASFFFAVAPDAAIRKARLSDTADSSKHLPLYLYETIGELTLPRGCALVGIELSDEAAVLPSFHHPSAAAYILGPERGSLSEAVCARCDRMVKIPTKFCVNVGVAGAIVMYDRLISRGGFAGRPLNPRAEGEAPSPHVRGAQRVRRGKTGAPGD